MPAWPELEPRLQALLAANAPRLDPVNWHYLHRLSERFATQTPTVKTALRPKLEQLLNQIEQAVAQPDASTSRAEPTPSRSALSLLLAEMGMPAALASPAQPAPQTLSTLPESPRVQQFRKQLRTLSVQKQVRTALSKAPQNAGPINSHMLVLRALGMMRELSPDYLQRFMTYVDTLILLENAVQGKKAAPKKSTSVRTAKKAA